MNIKKQIQQDIINALKAGNKDKLSVLRFLNSQIKDQEINQGRKELTDEQIISLISSQIKKLDESLTFFEKEQREELIKQAQTEMAVLKTYLPAQLSDEQLEKEIDQIIKENPVVPHPGALIGMAVKKLRGRADNKRISQMVMEKLKK